MGQEPRRSGRATKGQHTKNFDLDQPPAASSASATPTQPKRGKQSKKAKAAASEEPEEDEDSIIRCVCGATEDEGGLKMICCESCDAWQHNVCMGVTTDEDELEKLNYYCEQCRPEDHQDLLQAMSKGQKPWEERLRKHEAEEKAKEAEQKAAKKAKRGSRKSARQSGPAASEAASSPKGPSSQKSPTPAATETSAKRKYEAVVETSNGQSQEHIATGAPQQPPTPAAEVHDSATPEQSAKRAKSIAAAGRKPSMTSPVPRVDTIEQLPKDRASLANNLEKDFKKLVSEAVKDGSHTLPTGDTVESVSAKTALDIEHALHTRYREQQTQLNTQFRAIKFNLKKNQNLFIQILAGSLPPEELVELTPAEMASDELQQERQRLKEQADKQAVLAHEDGPRYRKTHKGDELIGDDSNKPTDVYKAPVRRGTLEQQPSDIPIDTGSPPPTTELPEDYDHTDRPEEPTSASKPDFNIQDVWGKVKADPAKAGMLPRQQKRQSISSKAQDVVMRDAADDPDLATILKDNDAEMKTSPSQADDATVAWRGRVEMNTVGEFSAFGKWAAGADVGARLPYHQLLQSRVEIDGRIPVERANEYIAGLRYSLSTDVCCLSILPHDNDQDRHGFDQVFNYFRDRNRWAVFTAHGHEAVRDIYIVPIEAGTKEKLPGFVTMLQESRIDNTRSQNMLLLTLVVRRPTSTTPALPSGAVQPALSHSSTPVNQTQPQFSPVPHGGPSFPPSQAPLPPLAIQVLGPFISAPVVSQMALNLPLMDEVQLQNLRDVLEREPAARGDVMSLSQYLAQRQMTSAAQP